MTQEEALAIMKDGRNAFLTGAAGSGKTHVLRQFIKHLRDNGKKAAVTASTGIAATHIHGGTIHSWAGFGIRERLSEFDIDILTQREPLVRKYEKTEVLIIDEVSMLHAFQLDFVDRLAREIRRSGEPFGGIQVVLCGDLFQLPPVSKGNSRPAFITESEVWDEADLNVCYLATQHRQEDETLLSVLSDIRAGDVSEMTKEPLRGRYRKRVENGVVPTKLFTHNVDVDRINAEEIAKIDSLPHYFEMETRGSKKRLESLKNNCLALEKLTLKKGAVVMFIKNDVEKKYVNGTMGVVEDFDKETKYPLVRTYSGRLVQAKPDSWHIEEDGKVKAEVVQVPLRLAWAITVHKSQGMSLDAAEIDLSKSFTPGMGYVALSRVRTLDGLALMGVNDMAFQIHPGMHELEEELQENSRRSAEDAGPLIKKQKKLEKEQEKKVKNLTQKKSTKFGEEALDSDGPSEMRKKAYSVEDIRKKYPKAFKRWSKEEEAELVTAFATTQDLQKLSKKFGRGTGGIRSRLISLGLIEE